MNEPSENQPTPPIQLNPASSPDPARPTFTTPQAQSPSSSAQPQNSEPKELSPDQNFGASSITELPQNVAAMLATLVPPVSGITFWMMDKTRQFVRFYAMQNILLGIVGALVWLAVFIVGIVRANLSGIFLIGPFMGLLHQLLFTAMAFGYVALIAFQVFKAWKDEEWEIPFLGAHARKMLAKSTSAA